jgi:argonaute-like protein implicated in RNA metabolism and viral defense
LDLTPGLRVRYFHDGKPVEGIIVCRCFVCSSGLKRYYTIEDSAGDRRCVAAVNPVGLPRYAAYRRQPEVKPLHVLDEA